MEEVYKTLKELGIEYEKREHPPVFTSEEADLHWKDIDPDTARCKNLFLRDQKKKRYFLVITGVKDRTNLEELAKELEVDKLSFCSPKDLQKYLNLTPGSVSPFGLINDPENKVEVLVSKELMDHPRVSFHPNINTATLIIKTEDFKKFLDWTKNPWRASQLGLS